MIEIDEKQIDASIDVLGKLAMTVIEIRDILKDKTTEPDLAELRKSMDSVQRMVEAEIDKLRKLY